MCPCGGLLEPCPCSGDCCPDCGCTTVAIWGSDDDYWDDQDLDDDGDLAPRVVTLQPAARYL